MKGIDTNILVRFLVNDDPEQAAPSLHSDLWPYQRTEAGRQMTDDGTSLCRSRASENMGDNAIPRTHRFLPSQG